MNIGMSAVNARIMICILSVLMPFVLWVSTGTKLDSLSEYFYTPMGPFFVAILTLTCYLMFTLPKWIPSAILLIVVIMFPNREFPMVHNIAAVLFFITSALAILFEGRYAFLGWLMLVFSPIAIFDLFYAELVMILCVSSYHLKTLLLVRTLLKKNKR